MKKLDKIVANYKPKANQEANIEYEKKKKVSLYFFFILFPQLLIFFLHLNWFDVSTAFDINSLEIVFLFFQAEGKKMRDDKEKVLEVLFALFEKHQYYNIKVISFTTILM